MATNKETMATMDVGTRLVVFGTLDCSVPCQRDDGERHEYSLISGRNMAMNKETMLVTYAYVLLCFEEAMVIWQVWAFIYSCG